MSLPSCENCKKQMKWGTVIKSLWLAYKPIKCDNCNVNHAITSTSRILAAILSVVLVLVSFLIFETFNIQSLVFVVIIASLMSLLYLLALPFMVVYVIKSESGLVKK